MRYRYALFRPLPLSDHLGHDNIKSTMIYLHLNLNRRRQMQRQFMIIMWRSNRSTCLNLSMVTWQTPYHNCHRNYNRSSRGHKRRKSAELSPCENNLVDIRSCPHPLPLTIAVMQLICLPRAGVRPGLVF